MWRTETESETSSKLASLYRVLGEMIPKPTLEKFLAYHRQNPAIYQAFKQKAQALLKSGRKKYGAKAIMEVVRYEYNIQHPKHEFKISNNYTAYYARALAVWNPEFKDFFDFKEIRGLSD